jgi:DNA-binding transcriptional LysR family regulator
MEIKHLRHFLAVYESRSYWRAAELFGLTPPGHRSWRQHS